MGCWLQLGNESHKGLPVGQGACCQIKSQHSSGPAGEIRASSAIHAAIQGDLLHSCRGVATETWGEESGGMNLMGTYSFSHAPIL